MLYYTLESFFFLKTLPLFHSELPPAPSDVSASNITDSSAVLGWSVAEGHSISKVIIRYQEVEEAAYSQRVDLGVQPFQNNMHFMLRGLRADTEYLLNLWTINNMGESKKKEKVSLRTLTLQESSRESYKHTHSTQTECKLYTM